MSYTLFVQGKITETTGGDHNVFSNKIISFNANGVITQTGEENGVTFGKPKDAPPLEINNIYVKVRLKESYNGEFGFDWVDVNPDTKDLEKIQDVDFSNVDYFYKKGATDGDLGNIIEKNTDETGAKTAIQEHYQFNKMCKHIDLPYVLIKPQQEITLSAEIISCDGTFNQDEIKITGDDFFEFEIIGGEKEGKTAKIKVSKAGKIDFKVKCLKDVATEKRYEFFHSSATITDLNIGGIVLMENKVLKLKFRVIALVSSDGSPADKAKALFKKFKDNDIKKYLNENSLNQAGYEVEIENQTMFDAIDTIDVDDYLYSFDKEEWKTKKYYNTQEREKYKLDSRGYGTKKPNGTWEVEKYNAEVLVENYDVEIIDSKTGQRKTENKINQQDNIILENYKQKLKSKNKTIYEDGYIILCDFLSSDKSTGAYSRTSPLSHYALIVYSSNTDSKDTYSHEIGHMLGLQHSFYTDKEKESYKNAREGIFGNNKPITDPNKRLGIKKVIIEVKASTNPYYGSDGLTAIKEDIIKYLRDYNTKSSKEITNEKKNITYINTTFVNYKGSDKISPNQTKKEQLDILTLLTE